MRLLTVPEVEQTRDTLFLYRALQKIRDAINNVITTLTAGTTTLVAGRATVGLTTLTSSSVIFVTRRLSRGTPGYIYADPADFDITAKTFVIRSTSGTDTSDVAWMHWA